MRGLVLAAILATSTVSCLAEPGARSGAADAVATVLRDTASAFERGDMAALELLWANDESVTVFESGHANYGWADYRDHHLKPEIAEMKNVTYRLSDIKPRVSAGTAWATFRYAIEADVEGKHVSSSGVGTAVLEKRGSAWRIVHWHSSAPRRAPAVAAAQQPSQTVDELAETLRQGGLDVKRVDTLRQPFFAVPATVLTVNGDDLQVYAYQSTEDAARDAAKIAPSGTTVGTTAVTWMQPPHIFRKGSLVAIYIGNQTDVRRVLTAELGSQIAGAP